MSRVQAQGQGRKASQRRGKPVKGVLQELVDVCEEVMEHLADGQCPLCHAHPPDDDHDETCPAVRIQAALDRARGDK